MKVKYRSRQICEKYPSLTVSSTQIPCFTWFVHERPSSWFTSLRSLCIKTCAILSDKFLPKWNNRGEVDMCGLHRCCIQEVDISDDSDQDSVATVVITIRRRSDVGRNVKPLNLENKKKLNKGKYIAVWLWKAYRGTFKSMSAAQSAISWIFPIY